MQLEADAGIPAEDRMVGYYAGIAGNAEAFDHARELIGEWTKICREDGYERDLGFVLMWRANVQLATGRLDEADELIAEHLALAESTGQVHNARWARFNGARPAIYRGDLARAASIGEQLISEGVEVGIPVAVIGHRAAGEAALYARDHASAVNHLRRVEELCVPARCDPSVLWHLPTYIEALIALGEVVEARSRLGFFRTRAVAADRRSAIGAAGRCEALLLAAAGDEAGAGAELDASLACHPEPADYPFERARTLMLRAQIHRKFRRKGSARSTLVAARDEFARIGATGWVNRLNEELCPCRGEPRETAGLTPTEQKVADLIVTGRRTKEVAAALYLSPKTVELPLTRVYRKYGVRSRVELGARMVARYT